MLNKSERFRVLKLYRICCILGLLPVQVDLNNWRLKVPWIGRRCVCFLFGSFLFIHPIYKNTSLVYAYFFHPNVQHHQLVLHITMAMASAMCLSWYERLYLRNPELLGQYLRMTLLGNVGGLWNEHDDEGNQNWTSRLREYSMQELIALSLPCLYILTIPVMITAYVYDPSMRLLLYTALPTQLQTWTIFGLCTLEDARLLLVNTVIVTPVWQLQVISYDLVGSRLQLLMRQIENGMRTTRGIYRSLRSLQLYVSTANDLNSYLIFTWKLLSISVSILTGYSAVAHFQQHPIFGIMYYMILFNVAFNYAVMYNKAFKIPQLFDQAAASALLHNRRGRRTDIFRRQILSIPRAGIKVGNFHKMERASTPIFIDFVLKKIVNLLVAYG